eukprot:7330678-Alexandrium_andersonii.AAC.1
MSSILLPICLISGGGNSAPFFTQASCTLYMSFPSHSVAYTQLSHFCAATSRGTVQKGHQWK